MSDTEFMLLDPDYSRHSRHQFLIRVLVIGFAFILGFVIISLILSDNAPALLKRPKFVVNCSQDYNYDFDLLTLRWPGSVCKDNDSCPKHPRDKWLIHGLWPTNNNQTWPQFCCFDRKLIIKDLDPIRSDLLNNWPNLELNRGVESLWQHEWQKHGTCTKTKQISYFNNTLTLYKKYPVFDWLKEAGIVPTNDKTYDVTAFDKVFADKFGKKVQLWCPTTMLDVTNRSKDHKIEEIRICLSKNTTQVIDCPEKSNCKTIVYPQTI